MSSLCDLCRFAAIVEFERETKIMCGMLNVRIVAPVIDCNKFDDVRTMPLESMYDAALYIVRGSDGKVSFLTAEEHASREGPKLILRGGTVGLAGGVL